MPLTNSMEASWAVASGKLYTLINEKNGLEGLFDVFTCQNKDPGFHFRRNYTLSKRCSSIRNTSKWTRPLETSGEADFQNL